MSKVPSGNEDSVGSPGNEDSVGSPGDVRGNREKVLGAGAEKERVAEDFEIAKTSRSSATSAAHDIDAVPRSVAQGTSSLSSPFVGLTNHDGELLRNRGNSIGNAGVPPSEDAKFPRNPTQENCDRNSSGPAQPPGSASSPANFREGQHTKTSDSVDFRQQVEGEDTPEQSMTTSTEYIVPKKGCKVQESQSSEHTEGIKTSMNMTPSVELIFSSLPTESPKDIKVKPSPNQSTGRWTPQEHEAFLEGLKVFGREWKKVAQRIPTRTSAQIRSHAQKYFAKLAREEQQQQRDFHGNATALARSSNSCAISLPLPPDSPATLVPPVPSSPGLSSTALDKVERILADPAQVQREVEDTLRALQERYRQLQLRLQNRQNRSREGATRTTGSDVVEDAENGAIDNSSKFPGSSAESMIRDGNDKLFSVFGVSTLRESRKRNAEEAKTDLSQSASNSDVSLLSHRQFGNEELIALDVLGGALLNGRDQMATSNEPRLGAAAPRDAASNDTSDDGRDSPGRDTNNNKKPRTN